MSRCRRSKDSRPILVSLQTKVRRVPFFPLTLTPPLLSLAALSEISAPTRWEDIQPYTTPDQLSEELLTLSLMPRSKWQTLLNLETIKQRNKPKEAPKAPERAPFFLPTLPGTDARFDFGAATATSKDGGGAGLVEDGKKRKLDYSLGNSIETDFVRRLLAEKESGTCESSSLCYVSNRNDLGGRKTDFSLPFSLFSFFFALHGKDQSFFEYLKALSPSALDLEIRSLTTLPHLARFLDALLARLRSHRDFEATETFLAVFLRVHGDVLVENPEDGIRDRMLAIQREQKREAERLIDLTHYNLGTLAFLRNVALT